MRILLFLIIGFVAGCGAGVWLPSGCWLLILAGVFFAAFLPLIVLRLHRIVKMVAVGLLGASVGLCFIFFYNQLYVSPARDLDGKTESVQIIVEDYVMESSYGVTGTGKVICNGNSYKTCFYLDEYADLEPGDSVIGTFRFRFTGKGGQESPTYHQGKGILLLAYESEEPAEYRSSDEVSWKYFAPILRRKILDKLHEIFPADQAGFAGALLLGDTSALYHSDDAALKISGIRHIVAVSGLHVSILAWFICELLRKNRVLQAVIGLPLLFVFCAVAGFTPSVVRASVMQGMIILAILVNKQYDLPTALAVAVLLIVLVNPMALTDAGFQLSVGCVVGMILFSTRIRNVFIRSGFLNFDNSSFLTKLLRLFISSVSVTLSTLSMTVPLSAAYFGTVSIVSVVTNFLTLWLVSACFCCTAVCCVLGFIYAPLGAAAAWVVSWPMRLVLWIAKLLSKIPFASISVDNPYFLCWVVLCYILLIVFLIFKKRQPFAFLGFVAAGFILSVILSCIEPGLDRYRMTVLDVGQGQCILLQSKNRCFVVDCGGDSPEATADLAATTLRSNGIQRVDGLILTHFDADHAGGAQYFVEQIKTDTVLVPQGSDESGSTEHLARYCDILTIHSECSFSCGVGKVTVYPGEAGKDHNESSLCILFQADECDILITGDRNAAGERYLLEQADIPELDVLVLGHHGAGTSSDLYFLQQTRPASVVISVGENNHYGHPSPSVLERLHRFDCIIWRTDQDGTIIFRG